MKHGMYAAGAAQLALGAVITFGADSEQWGAVGLVVAALGGVAVMLGFVLGQMPDPVEAEVDRWEAAWTSEWVPECPVHGDQLCPVRTSRCPAVRSQAA